MNYKNLLFPMPPSPITVSALLLVARIVFGLLFLNHGIAKWIAFDRIALTFPDPLGAGSEFSLMLVIFAEVFCSIGFILGLLFRLCLIPMIISMCVAFFVIHAGDTMSAKEPALMYMTLFVLMFVSGAGYFSFDTGFRTLFGKI